MKTAKDFRENARMALGGRWLPAVGTTFVASLFGADVTMTGSGLEVNLLGNASNQQSAVSGYYSNTPMVILWYFFAFIAAIAMVLMLVWLAQFFMGGFVSLGLIQYNLNLIDGKEASLGQIFSKTSLFGRALWLRIRMNIFVLLWSFLLIIPGIIKGYSYSMAGFVMAENPEVSAKEAMEISIRMMDGNKWRLFCLEISFIGWALLCVLSLGIGYLWLGPYINASYAAFYDEISRKEI